MKLDWMLARLAEPSTWRGLTAVLAAVGVAVRPDLWQEITTAGIAIAGAIEIIRKEGAAAVKNLIVIGLAGSALLLGGCAMPPLGTGSTGTNSIASSVFQSLAQDPADVCGIIYNAFPPYSGYMVVARTNSKGGGEVQVSQSGTCDIKRNAATP